MKLLDSRAQMGWRRLGERMECSRQSLFANVGCIRVILLHFPDHCKGGSCVCVCVMCVKCDVCLCVGGGGLVGRMAYVCSSHFLAMTILKICNGKTI